MTLEAQHISYRYPGGPWILRDVSFSVAAGERVALLGPSGYGKSTLSKLLSGYTMPEEGRILLDGKPLPRRGYSPVQLIYQHPEQAVNPLLRMRDILTEGWTPDADTLHAMGIEEKWYRRYPSELSGGELQRFCITRALGPATKFLICDEMSTMLDVINQTLIWQLLMRMAEQRGLGMVVVTHNHALAQRVCTRMVDLPALNHAAPQTDAV